MKILYNVKGVHFLFSMMVAIGISCSSSLTYTEAINKNESEISDPKKLEDAKFLVEAKSFNILETQLTKDAIKAGYSAALVELAKKNLEEHKDMSEELKDIAKKKDIRLPNDMNAQHAKLLSDISSTSREDFDQNFIRTLKQVNEENTYRFTNMATEAADADIRAFSARKLDMLRSHSKSIEEVEEQLLRTYK